MTAIELLQRARAEHGVAEGLELENGSVVIMRKPTLAEFTAAVNVSALEGNGELIADPQAAWNPLLALVVHGKDEARAQLEETPGFLNDLGNLMGALSGGKAPIEDAPDLIASEPLKAQLLGLRVAGEPMIVRKVTGFDWQQHKANLVNLPPASAVVALAEQQLFEAPDKDGKRPKWDALMDRCPLAAFELGSELSRRAKTRARRIQGK